MSKSKPEPEPEDGQASLTIRMSKNFRAYLERAARHSRLNVSTFLEKAAIFYAQHEKFEEDPPPR